MGKVNKRQDQFVGLAPAGSFPLEFSKGFTGGGKMSNSNEGFKNAKAEAAALKTKAKAMRPWFRKKRFLLPIILLLIIVLSTAANQGGTTDSSFEESSSAPSAQATSNDEAEVSTKPDYSGETVSQENARESAETYLRFSSFSREGLIEQLVFEDYSEADAEYAVDVLEVDWSEQAAGSAENYLSFSSFSESGLTDQLIFEGYTRAEAEYGVAAVNADWAEQAAKSAETYLNSSSFSKQGLIDQLVFEGFSQVDAEYGVSQNGY
jgi:hypothetical protein